MLELSSRHHVSPPKYRELFQVINFQERDLQTFFYIWATVAIVVFTLTFIFSYEFENGYRQTLTIAALALAWPCALSLMALVLAMIIALEYRHAGMHLAASQEGTRMRAHQKRKVAATGRSRGNDAPSEHMKVGYWRRRTGLASPHH